MCARRRSRWRNILSSRLGWQWWMSANQLTAQSPRKLFCWGEWKADSAEEESTYSALISLVFKCTPRWRDRDLARPPSSGCNNPQGISAIATIPFTPAWPVWRYTKEDGQQEPMFVWWRASPIVLPEPTEVGSKTSDAYHLGPMTT